MPADAPDVLILEVPDDPRFLGVTIVAVEALALRAGLDKEGVVELCDELHQAFADRFGQGRAGRVVLRYEVGDGFLGVRLIDGAETTRGATS